MKEILSEKERADLDRKITETEIVTNAQIVLASVQRCDSYVELPWKAFALGVSAAGLVVFLLGFFNRMPESFSGILLSIVVILAAGAVSALLTVICHPIARILLSEDRAETEIRQYAEASFLSHELFKTESRCAVLILTSIFEKRAVIVRDTGVAERIDEDKADFITEKMARYLKRKQVFKAMTAGLNGLREVLEKSAGRSTGGDILPNEIIEEKGI